MSDRPAGGGREFAIVLAVAAVLTAALTYPLAFRPGHVGRVDHADGQFSIWNVAWVARTLIVDPLHVYDANIFYPHRGTLAYSEANLGTGLDTSRVRVAKQDVMTKREWFQPEAEHPERDGKMRFVKVGHIFRKK